MRPPRNQPTRTGLGVTGVVFYAVLLVAGGEDVIAYVFRVPVDVLTYGFRTALIVFPLAAFWLTKRLCLSLQAHDRARIEHGDETGEVRQTAGGAYREGRTFLSPEPQDKLLIRSLTRPLTTEAGASRRARPRSALSRRYFRDRVELPATEEKRRRIAAVIADPAEAEQQDEQTTTRG